MATSSSKHRSSAPVLRSVSPPGRLYCSTAPNSSFSSSSSVFASYTSSSFSSPSTSFFHHDLHGHHTTNHHHHHHHQHHHQQRSASPTRINIYTSGSLSPSVRFSIDHRSISPNRSQFITSHHRPMSMPKKTCMCAPTTHPGSFRCHLHKKASNSRESHHAAPYPNNGLLLLRSAMKNSLVRIGGVEGEWVKRALTALIRPSSHQLRRRAAFEPTPSRLSIMSRTEDL